jgi:hypothetical protein
VGRLLDPIGSIKRPTPLGRPGAATAAGAVLVCVAVLAAAPAAHGRAPVVEQMVVFRSGEAVTKRVAARSVTMRVGRRRCAAGSGTALAALVRSRPGRLRLLDFGSCSRRARDGASLFVAGIRRDRNRGRNGWVYKVGRRAATAGAADPAGAFGRGRLRSGQRVTWFYCAMGAGGCQRTLGLRATTGTTPGELAVTVIGYDDEGSAVRVEGATVHAGGVEAVTGADGIARCALPPGRHRVLAEKRGLVRSFAEQVEVR